MLYNTSTIVNHHILSKEHAINTQAEKSVQSTNTIADAELEQIGLFLDRRMHHPGGFIRFFPATLPEACPQMGELERMRRVKV